MERIPCLLSPDRDKGRWSRRDGVRLEMSRGPPGVRLHVSLDLGPGEGGRRRCVPRVPKGLSCKIITVGVGATESPGGRVVVQGTKKGLRRGWRSLLKINHHSPTCHYKKIFERQK